MKKYTIEKKGEINAVLSKSLIFLFGVLTLFFLVISSFSGAAIAQFADQKMIELDLPVDPVDSNPKFTPNSFIVYGKMDIQENPLLSPDQVLPEERLITENVTYVVLDSSPDPPLSPLPNLEAFFEFGGTLELMTTDSSLSKDDVVISEIMWGLDEGTLHSQPDDTYIQWIELYNNSDEAITEGLYLLFTPLKNHPDRGEITPLDVDETIRPEFLGQSMYVLDAVSNLHLGKWDLPGRSGRLPYSSVISAYRDITYPRDGENKRADVPFGSYESSWKETPQQGSRNTAPSIAGGRGRVIATPGARHVPETLLDPSVTTEVFSDRVVINEVRNDISRYNHDWIELKNVGYEEVDLGDWELSIVTGAEKDEDLVDLPQYILFPEEILLIQRRHPSETHLADGIDISYPVNRPRGAIHLYLVKPSLNLPNEGRYTLLLRSESDKNGKDVAIEDYAGNGFFTYTKTFDTDFWPRVGQRRPRNVADFGDSGTFGSLNTAWARIRYQEDDGHHRDAWREINTEGGVGYDPDTDLSVSPGTPGYENDTLKTRLDDNNFRTPSIGNEYDEGELSISEIMLDAGPQGNKAQWIELYNSSLTQAVNLEGWTLEVYNLADGVGLYASGSFDFNEAVILPNQTLLLVSRNARVKNVLNNRIYDLYEQHRGDLKINDRGTLLLNPDGFYLRLIDKRYEQHNIRSIVIDEVGNLSAGSRGRTRWDLPSRGTERRRSLVRQYGEQFRPDERSLFNEPEPAEPGTLEDAWRQADLNSINTGITYYGDRNDLGTPGYRLGGPLPVQLSSFRPERTTAGKVSISWTTESELNNAGFNILRSKRHDGVFVVINPSLILGAGTSSEKHAYHFTDTTVKLDGAYYYRIEDVSFAGERRTLATTRLKGYLSVSDKLATTWGDMKR